jgi:type IX secretion system PorP/SprF family membrane protein
MKRSLQTSNTIVKFAKRMVGFPLRALVAIICLVISAPVFAQDIHFSEFNNSPLLYNPALSGRFEQTVKASLLRKTQYRSLAGGYTTNALDAQYKILGAYSDAFLGTGLFIYQDNAGKGQVKSFSALGSIAYHLAAGKKDLISAGFQVGFFQRSVDISSLSWDAQYDGIQYDASRDNKESYLAINAKTRIDLSMGVAWKHKRANKVDYDMGFAFKHTGQQQSPLLRGDDRLYMRQTYQFAKKKRYKYIDMRTDIMFQKQKRAHEIMLGVTMNYRLGEDSRYTGVNTSSSIGGGMYYRYRDGIHPFLVFEFKRVASLSVGYDLRTRKIKGAEGLTGGPEFCLPSLGAFDRKKMKIMGI